MGVNQRAQIQMTDVEVGQFLQRSRTATMATVGRDGLPHLVAMWYAFVEGRVYIETKIKSQKAVNLRRDPRVVISVEAGDAYDQLRGVSIDGTAHIVEDPDCDEYLAALLHLFERYSTPTDDVKAVVDKMMYNRILVRIDPLRIRSWDHRKLGLPASAVEGTTAAFVSSP